MAKPKVLISYRITFYILNCPPLKIEIHFHTPREFIRELIRIARTKRVYSAFRRNEGIEVKAISKLASVPGPLKTRVAKVLLVFAFTEAQKITNAIIFANGKSKGLDDRTIEIYQLFYAGVLFKNIPDYLHICEKTARNRFTEGRRKLGFEFNSQMKSYLVTPNPVL